MKRLIGISVLILSWGALTLGAVGGCGSSSTSSGSGDGSGDSDTGGGGATGSKSWSEEGAELAIDDIVNGSGSGAALDVAQTKGVTTSSDAAFYFGRFLATDGVNLVTGSVKFKLNKQNDTSAFFSNFSLEHYSQVTDFNAHSDIVTSSTDLAVNASFDASTNHVEISDSAQRFVAFDLDFGNNDFFGDIVNAGVVFSSDFTTMAGGDNASFFFIAQKVSSQPDASESAILGDLNTLNFIVSTAGEIIPQSTSSVTVGGVGPNGFTAFEGSTSGDGTFSGELALADAESGAFLFGFGTSGIDGAFLLSADQSLLLGIDVTDGLYFAAER